MPAPLAAVRAGGRCAELGAWPRAPGSRWPPARPPLRRAASRAVLGRVRVRTAVAAAAGTAAGNGGRAGAGDNLGVNPTAVSATGLPRDAVVGVLGGGQLGRMLALAAAAMGVRVRVLDPTPDAPAAVAAEHVVGSFRDAAAVAAFAAGCDVLTVEIEHVDVAALEALAGSPGAPDIQPTPRTIRVIQDKLLQKRHFVAAGVPLADFADVPDLAALQAAGASFGFPLMLKSRRGAYDGKGNVAVSAPTDLSAAAAALGGFSAGLYAEKWVPFKAELAIMVARSKAGHVVLYPVVETSHVDSICDTVVAPADIPPATAAAAAAVARAAVGALDGAGVFGVELFLAADGRVLLNEVAPRPHNSGHYTIEACITSQYEQQVRAVLGWPLGDPGLKVGAAAMVNILGTASGPPGTAAAHAVLARALVTPGATGHWYGKVEVSPGRKVGHVTIVANSRWAALAALASVRGTWPAGGRPPPPLVGIIMGSDSDLATMRAAAECLESLGVPVEVTIVSAHRTPDRLVTYARGAARRGLRVIIAGAGGAAHLPGMVAALTPLPVVGVPVLPATAAALNGVDALLSMVQMPKGVPVATVAIGNAANAGLLAARILGVADEALRGRMEAYQAAMEVEVLAKAEALEAKGWR